MTNSDNERSIEREIDDVYERFDNVDEGVDDVYEGSDDVADGLGERRLRLMERSIDDVDEGVDDVDEGLSEKGERCERVIDDMDARFDDVDEGVDDVESGLVERGDERHEQEIDDVDKGSDDVYKGVDDDVSDELGERGQRLMERDIDDVEEGVDDVEEGVEDEVSEGLWERGERLVGYLRAMDMQVMGACRGDERLKPLFKLNVSCDAAEHRFFAHLTQHFEPSEVGKLARCLCVPLVSLRVGKINKQGTLLCPTAIRGNLNLTLLPTSELRISFTGDDGHMVRLATLIGDSLSSDIAVEEILSDTSGRSFLLKVPDGKVFYFWSSEKSKLVGNELLAKMKDLLERKPSLAELTGISQSRLKCFATYLRAYFGSSLSTTRSAASITNPSDSSSDSLGNSYLAIQSSSSKPSCSRNVTSQSFQVNLGPRSGSFKEGSSRNLSSLRSVGRDKSRRKENILSGADSLSSALPNISPQNCKTEETTKEQFSTPNILGSLGNLASLPYLSPVSQVTSLASSLLSPYYCWCPPVASPMQCTALPQLPFSSNNSLHLPPLSSLLPMNRSSNVLTPTLEIPEMPKLGYPPLFPDPLMRFPLPRSSSQQFAAFTPLMCDPIVHIPFIDVCSSGPSYLVSAGSSLSSGIGNPLISESDSVAEEGARATLRLLMSGSNQTNSQLMDVFPSVLTVSEDRHGILASGSRGLYTGVRDIDVFTNSFANLELVSFENLTGSDTANSGAMERGFTDEVEKSDGIEDDDDNFFNSERSI